MKSLLLFIFLPLMVIQQLTGAPAVKLADHPTSPATSYRAIHNARKFNGRIFFGYGNWDGYCATTLTSYDPAAHELNIEFSSSSDSIEMIRPIGGSLYIPHCDPIHHEDFHDYSVLSADGRWRGHSPIENLHVFDFAVASHGLYCAANGLWRSQDAGATWTQIAASDRRYWCAVLNDTVYTQYEKVSATGTSAGTGFAYWNQVEVFRDTGLGTDILVGLTSKIPGIGASHSGLMLYNGTTSKTISARHFTIANGELHILGTTTPPQIRKTSDPWSSAPVYTSVNVTNIPSAASCLEYLNGRYYIGTTSGQIWVANEDCSEVTPGSSPTVRAGLYDSFGRGLALWNDSLLAGAPDASGTAFLQGSAGFWTNAGGTWQAGQTLVPPVPDFSGWFGKDVAMLDDLAAVVEAGHDTTGSDRGASAKVHLYQLSGGAWQLRHTAAIPFAQSAALQADMLVVGTSNQAANQASGRPGVVPFSLTRNAGLVTVTQRSLVFPTSTAYGYKALARVALLDDLLIAGFSSDPSRTATGMISVYRRNATSFTTPSLQEFTNSAGNRFGFSLAADSGWVAVGAPFFDTMGRNSGAVLLYEKTASLTAPLVLRQTLVPPFIQPHAEFGYSVAMQGGLLIVGCPGRNTGSGIRSGAVFRYRLQPDGTWLPAGEVPPPEAAESEYGIEVAANARWIAAGCLGCRAGTTGLESRVRIIPRNAYQEWLDSRLFAGDRSPTEDQDGDGLDNLTEYVSNLPPAGGAIVSAGTDPGRPQSGIPVLSRLPDGQRAVTLTRPAADPNLSFRLQYSDDLVTWSDFDLPLEVLSTGTTHELARMTLPAGWDHRFIRGTATYLSAP